MTTHYHGGPLWGGDELLKALYGNGGALVSFARPEQIRKIATLNCRLVLDNGAFSFWKKAAGSTTDWTGYYQWVQLWYHRIEWYIIPDVIEGTEQENDTLVSRVPLVLRDKAVPVWHSDESIDRLIRLCNQFDRVAIGCCGPHRSIRSAAWKRRMDEAFTAVYIEHQIPVKLHGLRMLDGRALSQYPFDSADSTNVAINVPKTRYKFPAVTDKLHRVGILRAAIEKVSPPTVAEWMRPVVVPLTGIRALTWGERQRRFGRTVVYIYVGMRDVVKTLGIPVFYLRDGKPVSVHDVCEPEPYIKFCNDLLGEGQYELFQ